MTFIIRSGEAEFLGADGYPTAIRLLADASNTDGALSTQRVTLGSGADGASPHLHKGSSELFCQPGGPARRAGSLRQPRPRQPRMARGQDFALVLMPNRTSR